MDEDALVARARAGDADAFTALVEPLRPGLIRFAGMVSGDMRDGEDALQEALARALRDIERFEARASFRAWIYGIARNVALRWRRDRARKPALDGMDLDRQPIGLRGVVSSVLRRELAERLDLALERLPEAYREAFVLRHMDGMSYAEIGAITGTQEGTARVRALRARTVLKTELGDVVDTVWRES